MDTNDEPPSAPSDSMGAADISIPQTPPPGRKAHAAASSRRPHSRPGVVTRQVGAGRKDAAKASLPPTRKGSETRERLKAAALRALEVKGYRNLRLTDIAIEANVNISLVYHYFQDKADLVFEALRGMISIRQLIEADTERPHGSFAALYYANKRFADFYKTHPGLIRSLLHFDEENPEFHALYAEVNQNWMDHIARNMQKRGDSIDLTSDDTYPIAYALGSMVEKFLFDLYVERNPRLVANFQNSDKAARFLAILWYRAFYLCNPSDAELASFPVFDHLQMTDMMQHQAYADLPAINPEHDPGDDQPVLT